MSKETIKAKFEMSLWLRIKAACGVWWAIVVTKEVECFDDEPQETNLDDREPTGEQMKCKNCKWWDDSNGEYSCCKRNPPMFIPSYTAKIWNLDNDVAWWPVVKPANWCGEYKK